VKKYEFLTFFTKSSVEKQHFFGENVDAKFKKEVFLHVRLDFTVILSFLMGERDRDLANVSDRDLVQYDRFRPFTVPDPSPSLTLHRP
jgi:hypothetical protein